MITVQEAISQLIVLSSFCQPTTNIQLISSKGGTIYSGSWLERNFWKYANSEISHININVDDNRIIFFVTRLLN